MVAEKLPVLVAVFFWFSLFYDYGGGDYSLVFSGFLGERGLLFLEFFLADLFFDVVDFAGTAGDYADFWDRVRWGRGVVGGFGFHFFLHLVLFCCDGGKDFLGFGLAAWGWVVLEV